MIGPNEVATIALLIAIIYWRPTISVYFGKEKDKEDGAVTPSSKNKKA